MSLNITSIANQYPDYAGYFMKAYELGTSTPKAIYFDDRKLSGTVRLKLDKDGFAISDGGAKVIPHIEGYYDIYFFKTKKEADENDFTNAISLGDRLIAEISGENITKASETEYGSIRFAKDNELFIGGEFPDSVAVERSKITRMGEISAEEQKAVEDDLIARDDTKWLSPNDVNYMITEFGAPNQEREKLPIGTTIWMDKETAKTRDDLLPQNNELFDPVEYPLLAAKSGYSQVGSTTVDGFSNPNETLIQSGHSYLYIKVSDTEFYGVVDIGATNHPCFSSDGGLTWTINTSVTVAATQSVTKLAYNDGKLGIGYGGGYYLYYDFNTSTMLVNGVRPYNYGNICAFHYNETLGKFISFQTYSSAPSLMIIETTDFVTFSNTLVSDNSGRIPDNVVSYNEKGSYSYHNGKYYFEDMVRNEIISIEEGTWAYNLEYSFTTTLTNRTSSTRPVNMYIDENGDICYLVAYNGNDAEIITRINDVWSIQTITLSDSVTVDSFIYKIIDSFVIIHGTSIASISFTKDLSTVDYFHSFTNATTTNIISGYNSINSKSTLIKTYLSTVDIELNIESTDPNYVDRSYGDTVPVVYAGTPQF